MATTHRSSCGVEPKRTSKLRRTTKDDSAGIGLGHPAKSLSRGLRHVASIHAIVNLSRVTTTTSITLNARSRLERRQLVIFIMDMFTDLSFRNTMPWSMNRPSRDTATQSPCSCVPALRGTLAGSGSAVARASVFPDWVQVVPHCAAVTGSRGNGGTFPSQTHKSGPA